MIDQKDVDSTFKSVSSTDHTEGAVKAYDKLKSEYDTYAKNHGGATSEDSKEYWKQLSAKLVSENLINDISIGWASEHGSEYADGKGRIEKRDLRSVVANNDNPDGPSAVDATLSNALQKNFTAITQMHTDSVEGFFGIGSHEDDAITTSDINEYLHRNQSVASQDKAASDMTQLFADNSLLFRTLDTIGSATADNKITKNDLWKYMSDYNRDTHNGANEQPDGTEFSEANKACVQKLLDTWDQDEGKTLRNGASVYPDAINPLHIIFNGAVVDDQISLDTLGRAAGLTGVNNDDVDLFNSKLQEKNAALAKQDGAPVESTASIVPSVAASSSTDNTSGTNSSSNASGDGAGSGTSGANTNSGTSGAGTNNTSTVDGSANM